MAKLRSLRLEAELDNGDVVELLNFAINDDGTVQEPDQSSLDVMMQSPETARLWGNVFCSVGKVLLTAVDVFEAMNRG